MNYFARGEGSCDECMGGYIYGEGGGGGGGGKEGCMSVGGKCPNFKPIVHNLSSSRTPFKK